MQKFTKLIFILVPISILLSAGLLILKEVEPHQVLPIPSDTKILSKEEDESEDLRRRVEWIERIHKTAPGIDWRAIEKQNRWNKYQMSLFRDQQKSISDLQTIISGVLTGTWNEKGSDNLAGRTRTADYDTSARRVYLASDGGNIWKGKLDGSEWQVLNDQLNFGSIHLVRVIYRNEQRRILVGTEERSIYFSDDDGTTWETASGFGSLSGSGEQIIRTQVSDDSLRTVYSIIAERITPSTSRVISLFKSVDLGATFTRVLTLPQSVSVSPNAVDLWCPQYGFADPRIMMNYQTFRFDVGGDSLVSTGDLPGQPGGYAILTGYLAPDGNVFEYAYINENIYRSADGGNQWTFRNNIAKSPFFKTSFSSSVSTVDKLFFGDIECHRSENGGSAWTRINPWTDYYQNILSKLHADIPSVNGLLNENGNEFFLINTDGGTYYSQTGVQVTNISVQGLRVSQYYSSLTSVFDTNWVHLGSQDQGYQREFPDNGGLLTPEQVVSGDYGHIVSGDDGSSIWMVYPGFAIFYPDAGGLSDITWDFDGNNAFWIPPLMADPEFESICYMANGARITKMTASGGNINTVNLPIIFQGAVSAMAFSKVNFNYWYVLTETGKFYRSTDRGDSWTIANVSNAPEGQYLYGACIYPSRNTLGEVMIAGSGYSNAPVYKSFDNGGSFTPYAQGLPSTLVFRLAGTPIDEYIFAATEAGPYVLSKETGEWHELGVGIAPDQTYWSVEYIDQMKVARFVTYGRGAWDFRIASPLSINKVEQASFEVWPNPATDFVQFKTDFKGSVNASIHAMNGKQIIGDFKIASSGTIDLHGIPSGIYIVQLNNGSRKINKKIVITR
jgi:photosystem II stability/assembly factor-like uncharacterized protein